MNYLQVVQVFRRTPVLKLGSYNKRMIFLDMLGVAKCQNSSMLRFDLGLDLKPVRLLCKLKGEGRRIYEFSADYVDSMANLVSA